MAASTTRSAFLDGHLGAALRSRNKGVDLRGYSAWSLRDNFECAEGYAGRFGPVHVDFKTQKRTPQASCRFLSRVVRSQT